MRAALHRVESDCLKPIYDNLFSKEETLELVVPDVSADIGTILDVRGQFLLSSQRVRTDEIYISAAVELSVIYAADDSGKTQYIMTNIPFDMTIPVSGADDNCKIVSRWELCGLDARMLNPRKLLLRADVSSRIVVYAPDKFVLWDNLSGEETVPVYILQKETEHTLVTGIREKSFNISDEYRLPGDGDRNAKMLSAATEICVQDVKAVGNKVVIKALAKTTGVFMDENDGNLFDGLFTTQFSQIIEVDGIGDGVTHAVSIQLRDAEFTISSGREDGFVCSASFQMAAQVVCRDMVKSMYIADAYSNEYALTSETSEVKLMKCMPHAPMTLSLRGMLKPDPTLAEIMYADVTEVCTEAAGNILRVVVEVGGVGKKDTGELEAISLKLTAEETVDLSKNQRLYVAAVCCDKAAVTGTAQNAEISVGVDVTCCIKETFEISAVSGIEICEDCPIERDGRPSLVVICSDRGGDLWSLAKKYGSTVEMIEKANKFGEDLNLGCRPLLIPRAN